METTVTLTQDEARLLREVALFADLDDAAIQDLMTQLKRRRFRSGEVIYHTEDLPGSVYVVMKGELKLRLQSPSGKQLTMSLVTPGSFFGTISLLDGKERLADAVAMRPCELLVLGRDDFRAFLRQHPRQTELLLEITAARWRNTMRRLAELAFLDVPGRLAKTLLDFGRAGGSDTAKAQPVVSLTQNELAGLVGSSRESVGRWLRVFADAGAIEFRRANLRVIDRSKLDAYVRW